MKRSLIILGGLLILQLVGCKAIVKDYSVTELDSLDLVLTGEGYMPRGSFTDIDDELIWTCPGGAPKLTVIVKNRKASTKLELAGRYFREVSEVNDRGTVLVSSSYFKYNLNLKVDLKRQEAKMNISRNTTVNSGCQSKWFDLKIVES
ncbi:MAG: hypothetical protein V7784_06375 [Oceanospirillaceae bacterium]